MCWWTHRQHFRSIYLETLLSQGLRCCVSFHCCLFCCSSSSQVQGKGTGDLISKEKVWDHVNLRMSERGDCRLLLQPFLPSISSFTKCDPLAGENSVFSKAEPQGNKLLLWVDTNRNEFNGTFKGGWALSHNVVLKLFKIFILFLFFKFYLYTLSLFIPYRSFEYITASRLVFLWNSQVWEVVGFCFLCIFLSSFPSVSLFALSYSFMLVFDLSYYI